MFATYQPAAPMLATCHCNVCMTEDTDRHLIETPLREIPSRLLAEYTSSAHDWDDGPVAREMRYFLPRYFELIADHDPPDNLGLDICLRRLGRAGWRAKWPSEEQRVIDHFFDAFLVASLSRLDLVQWPVGWRLELDMADVLTLIVTADGDLDRVLAVWDGAADPAAAIHMAALRGEVYGTRLHSEYLADHEAAADKIGAFVMRPEVDRRIEMAFFTVVDSRLQQILSDAMAR